MQAISQFSSFRLGITPGVPSSQLSALLALQRQEEPEVRITLSEVSVTELIAGLDEARYDVGMSFQGCVERSSLLCQPLWAEEMAVAVPSCSPLLHRAKLSASDLLDYAVFRWQAEVCSSLEQWISMTSHQRRYDVRYVASFELMALWVAAGYGIGIASQSRIARAQVCKISMKPFADGPHSIVTWLLRSCWCRNSAVDRFGRRALRIAESSRA